MDYKDIELVYEEHDPVPAVVAGIGRVAGVILSSLLTGMIDAGKTALTEAAKLATLERLTAVVSENLREMAGTWVSKTMIDASQSEFLGSLLHAIGLDTTDLLDVVNKSLDKGFLRFEEAFLTNMEREGFQREALAGVWRIGFAEHKAGVSESMIQSAQITKTSIDMLNYSWADATRDSIRYQTLEGNKQEELTRGELRSIFGETPEKIAARQTIQTKESLGATGSWAAEKLDKDLPGIVQKLGKSIEPLKDWLVNQTDTFARSVMHLITAKIPVTPESGYANGVTAFGLATGFGALAHGICAAAEIIHPLKSMGFNHLAAYLVDIANFAPISRASWGQYIKSALQIPSEYAINRELRPILPDPITLQMMAVKPDITMPDFRRGMSYAGFSEPWISAIQKTMFKEPRYFELSIMLEDATVDLDWLYKKCRRAGYNPKDAEVLVGGLLVKVLRPYLQEYRTRLTYLYGDGFINEQQFDAFLAPLLLRPEAHSLLKKASRFRYISDYTRDSIALFTSMHDKDLLDDDDLETSLTSLGIREEKLRMIINRQRVKRTARVAREEKTELKSLMRKQQNLIIRRYSLAYRQGRIESLEFRRALLDAGLDERLVELTVELENEKRLITDMKTEMQSIATETQKINKLYEKGYLELFRKDLISSDKLEEYLTGLNLEPEYIAAVISTEQVKKLTPETIFPTGV